MIELEYIKDKINLIIDNSKKEYIEEQQKNDEIKRTEKNKASEYEVLTCSNHVKVTSTIFLIPISFFIIYKLYIFFSGITPLSLSSSSVSLSDKAFIQSLFALLVSSTINFAITGGIILGILKIFGKKQIITPKIEENYKNYNESFSHSKISKDTETALKLFLPHDLYLMLHSSGRKYRTTNHDVIRFLDNIEENYNYLKNIENKKYHIDMKELKNNQIISNLITK